MPTRWSTSIEPTALEMRIGEQRGVLIEQAGAPLEIRIGEHRGILIDQARLTPESRADIYPGEKSELGVAAKFDDDVDCFGWSNLNYFSNPQWRNPDFKLEHRRYLVKITVTSASQQVSKVVRLLNDVPRASFRLEEPQPEDPEL
jgi:hypothetical protein